MDVINVEQALIAEAAGACAVMALERVPADIRKNGMFFLALSLVFSIRKEPFMRSSASALLLFVSQRSNPRSLT